MRILLLGEYSNVHNTLAKGLRELGHEVTVASNGDFWKNYPRDIDLSRGEGGVLSNLSFAWRMLRALPKMRGYDIVQLINPVFIELKPERLFGIYNYLRRHNKRVVLGAFGMDYYWVDVNTRLKPLRYSDFNIGDEVRHNADAEREREEWIGTPKQRLNEMIAHDCDAIVAGLYEYKVTYAEFGKTCFIPYPIADEESTDVAAENKRLTIFAGISRNRSEYKGTDIMLRAAEDVKKAYPDRVDLRVVEGVPYAEYQRLMNSSDAILDQLYSYTPAMNALLAMSKGIIVVGGGEPENYDVLGEKDLRPIVNVLPTYQSCYDELEQLVLHPERLPLLKAQSKEYIHRHHHYLKVAKQYVELYERIL